MDYRCVKCSNRFIFTDEEYFRFFICPQGKKDKDNHDFDCYPGVLSTELKNYPNRDPYFQEDLEKASFDNKRKQSDEFERMMSELKAYGDIHWHL